MNQDFKDHPDQPNLNNSVAQLVTTKPDAEVAEELKAELMEALAPVTVIATKALALGFQVQMNMGANAFKQVQVQQLQLLKVF